MRAPAHRLTPTRAALAAASVALTALALSLSTGCSGGQSPATGQPPGTGTTADRAARVASLFPNAEALRGISYSPYRAGQRPGGPAPSEAQILEDLEILAPRWPMIRLYDARPPHDTIVRLIAERGLPIRVLLGAWIDPEARRNEDGTVAEVLSENVAVNRRSVDALIALANAYPEIVFAVSVGNESQVFWSAHRTAPEVLTGYLRRVREAVDQPVSTADDYNFWNKPESDAIAAEIDFIVLHAYAIWNRQHIGEAVDWTRAEVAAIRARHPTRTVVLGETGWATDRHPNPTGDEAAQVVGEASEENQRTFYRAFTAMAEAERLPYFYFEAFDEPWKGRDHPQEMEKHWGLYDVDRTPKLVLQDAD